MPKPIKDMNAKQWARAEKEIHALLTCGQTGVRTDRDIAVQSLDAVFGRHGPNGFKPPSGGYTDALIDGLVSIIPSRRKQYGVEVPA